MNKTRDTLILKSDKIINSLYTINKDYGRELDFEIDTTAYKLPLNKLSVGKHVFVVIQSPMRIIFVVKIIEDIPIEQPEELINKDMVALEHVITTFTSSSN